MCDASFVQTSADVVAAAAAVATVGVGGYALSYAKQQIGASKEALAKTLFREHLEMAVSHPEISSYAAYLVSAGRAKDAEARLQLNETYRWFIAHLLLTQEEVLDLVGDDKEWHGAVMSNLISHAPYFTRPYWQTKSRGNYSAALVAAVDKAIANFEARFGVPAADVQDGPAEVDFSMLKSRA